VRVQLCNATVLLLSRGAMCRCLLSGKTGRHVKVGAGGRCNRLVQARCRYACFGVAGLQYRCGGTCRSEGGEEKVG
jgi:hypothetical protein